MMGRRRGRVQKTERLGIAGTPLPARKHIPIGAAWWRQPCTTPQRRGPWLRYLRLASSRVRRSAAVRLLSPSREILAKMSSTCCCSGRESRRVWNRVARFGIHASNGNVFIQAPLGPRCGDGELQPSQRIPAGLHLNAADTGFASRSRT